MPILYDFDCQEHGRFEKFAKMDDCEKPQPCPECGAESPRIYVAFSPRDYLETLVVYKRPDGTYGLPGQKDALIPEGCERIELRETWQKRQVEREIDREHREKWERARIGKEMQSEIVTRHNRAELRQVMQQGGYIIGKDGERRFVPPMRESQRDFARFAMRENDNRPREKYQGAFFFDALSRDASNREDGRNRDGGRMRK
jgi:putative FmdB family regulatory protein